MGNETECKSVSPLSSPLVTTKSPYSSSSSGVSWISSSSPKGSRRIPYALHIAHSYTINKLQVQLTQLVDIKKQKKLEQQRMATIHHQQQQAPPPQPMYTHYNYHQTRPPMHAHPHYAQRPPPYHPYHHTPPHPKYNKYAHTQRKQDIARTASPQYISYHHQQQK